MCKPWVWCAGLIVCGALWAPVVSVVSAQAPDEFGDDPEMGDHDDPDAQEVIDHEPSMEATLGRDPNADQWLVGLQWRQLIIPAFVQQIFLDEAPTVFQPTFQIVATKRTSENFSLVFGLGYASYAFEGLYRAKGDPIQDTEWLDSNLGLLHGTISALWATRLADQFHLEYGIGGEIGVVLGELRRSEAHNTGGTWGPCSGPFQPPTIAPTGVPYCNQGSVAYDEDGEHYNVVEERIPPVWLLPTLFQLGLRFEPVPQVAVKLEVAYATLAFWFGASVHVNLSQM